MHDHATDGGRGAFEAKVSARELRLHLDNAHDTRTSGLDFDALAAMHAERHRKAHKDARLAEIEAAAELISGQLAAAPPTVVESIVGDDDTYLNLKGAREKLCKAQTLISDCGALGRHARGNLGRAIVLIDAVGTEWCDQWSRFDQPAEPPSVIDLMDALEESLAKVKRTLGKTSGTAQPPDAPAGAGEQTPPLPAPPCSEPWDDVHVIAGGDHA